MLDLKELFTTSQANIRPAHPPVGQWDAIQQRLEGAYSGGAFTTSVPGPGPSPLSFLVGLGTGIGAGAVLTALVFVVFLTPATTPPEVKISTDQITMTSITAEPGAEIVGASTIGKAIIAGLYLPGENDEARKVASDYGVQSREILSGKTFPVRTRFFSGDAGDLPHLPEKHSSTSSGLTTIDEQGQNVAVKNRSSTEAVLRLPEESIPALEADFSDIAQGAPISPPDTTFARGSGRKSRWSFEPTPLRQDPSPYWEVGLHASPWLTSSSWLDGPDEYRVSTPGEQPSLFVLSGGETVELTRVRPLDEFYRKRLYTNQFHLEGSRQLGNGLRFGAGLLWEDYDRGEFEQAGALASLVPEDGWLYLAEEDYKILSATLTAGYTFRRRMRLRYSVGLMATGQLYSRYTERSALLERATGVLHPQRNLTSINGHFLPSLGVRPVFGVQYQLARNLSLGLEVTTGMDGLRQVPEFGIGGRWQIR